MRAVAMRVGSSLRRGWMMAALIALIVALVAGAAMSLSAGARRTATAADRYTANAGGDPDGLITQPLGLPRTNEIRALPGVESVEALTFIGADWNEGNLDVNPFVADMTDSVLRPITEGRAPEPDRPHEFAANRAFLDLFDMRIGDRIPVKTWTVQQVEENAFFNPPAGPTFDAELVGVVATPDDLDDPTASALFPVSLLDSDVGGVTTLIAVWLRDGVTRADLRAQLDALPDGVELALDDAPVVSATVRNAVEAQALGLWIVAVVALVAGVATLGQILSRIARVGEADRRKLVALGFSRGQVIAEAVGRALGPVAVGVGVGTLLAIVASTWFPSGFVRAVEPHPGIDVNVGLLVGVGAVFVVGVLAWVAVAAWLGQRGHRIDRPSRVVDTVANRVGSASAAAGMRFAFARSHRESGSVAGTMVGLTLAMTGLAGASVFALSVDRLVEDGARFGNNYDVMVGNGWLPAGTDLRVALGGDPDVERLMLLGASMARADESNVELVAVDRVSGGLSPTVLEGRMPVSDDEISFGRVTAARLGLSVGDRVTLAGTAAPTEFRVVGLAVVPAIGVNRGVGEGALVTPGGAAAVTPELSLSVAAIVLRDGAPPEAVERLSRISFTPPGSLTTPAAIRNVARIDRVPLVLAGLLAALAMLLLAHALVQSVRARRNDHAVLRALGANRSDVGRTVHWQATAMVAVPLLLGIPTGVILGRIVFSEFANRIGAVARASVSILVILAIVSISVAAANVISTLPARRARRVPPATLLRAE